MYRWIGFEIYDFYNFFQIFWTPNGHKRLVGTVSKRGADVACVDQSRDTTSFSPPTPLPPRALSTAPVRGGATARLSPPSRPVAHANPGESGWATRPRHPSRPNGHMGSIPIGVLTRQPTEGCTHGGRLIGGACRNQECNGNATCN
jgi:hypothetical protein